MCFSPVYPATSITDLSAVDAALKAMELQVQTIKDRVRDETLAIPKAKVLFYSLSLFCVSVLAFFFFFFFLISCIMVFVFLFIYFFWGNGIIKPIFLEGTFRTKKSRAEVNHSDWFSWDLIEIHFVFCNYRKLTELRLALVFGSVTIAPILEVEKVSENLEAKENVWKLLFFE